MYTQSDTNSKLCAVEIELLRLNLTYLLLGNVASIRCLCRVWMPTDLQTGNLLYILCYVHIPSIHLLLEVNVLFRTESAP